MTIKIVIIISSGPKPEHSGNFLFHSTINIFNKAFLMSKEKTYQVPFFQNRVLSEFRHTWFFLPTTVKNFHRGFPILTSI